MKKKHLLIIATWLMLLTVSMSMLTFVGCGDGGKKVLHVDTEIEARITLMTATLKTR